MAKYPIKMLLDEKKNPFFPVVTIDTVLVNETEQTAADMFADRYTKAEIDKIIADLGTLQRLCGKVNSIEALPNNARPGDTYIVTDASGNNSEYMYIGDKWEELGPMIDLSGYDTSEEVDAKLSSLKDNVNETAETNSAEALKQAQQYADTKAATLATDALTDAKAYTDEVIAQAGTGASLKSVPADEYTEGMEQSNPILVVYKKQHVIDPATEFKLETGTVFTTNYADEKQYKMNTHGTDDLGEYYDVVFENTDDVATFKHDGVSFDAYNVYGDWKANYYLNFQNESGSNLIGPGETSTPAKLRIYERDLAYLKVNQENVSRGVPQENPEEVGNMLVASVGIKERGDIVHKVISHIDGVVTMEVTNIHPENKIHIPTLRYIFKDYYGFNYVFSEQYDVTLEPGASFTCGTYVDDFFLAILDDNYEIIAPVEIQPYQLKAEVGSTTVPQGDFSYELITLDCGVSTAVEIKITNTRDFAIAIPRAFAYNVFDKYGTNIATLQAYIGAGKLEAGGSAIISSGITQDLSNAAYFEMATDFWHILDTTYDLIPIAGSKITTDNGLEVAFTTQRYDGSSYTLELRVVNKSDVEVVVDDKLDLYDADGNLITTLVCFGGVLNPGIVAKPTASCDIDCTNVYYIHYRKESE